MQVVADQSNERDKAIRERLDGILKGRYRPKSGEVKTLRVDLEKSKAEGPLIQQRKAAMNMKFDAYQTTIGVDGLFADWDCIPFMGQPVFQAPATHPKEIFTFEEYNHGTWKGIYDHSVALSFAWDANSFYIGVKVVDDTHENAGSGNGRERRRSSSGWPRARTGYCCTCRWFIGGVRRASHLRRDKCPHEKQSD